ncbi:MAG: GNVR domain-containing protein, partial [Betaproteobacteria bacterium]
SDVPQGLGASETGNISDVPSQKTQKPGMEPSKSGLSNRPNIAALERDRDTYKKIYEQLLATMGRSEVSSQIEAQDKGGAFRILEPAMLPFSPVSPDRVKIILLGLLGGIGGGIGFIILLENMNKSVNTVDNLKTFGLPVLAVIPHIQNPVDIQRMRRNDLLLYVTAGVYLVCVAGLLTFEFLKRGM